MDGLEVTLTRVEWSDEVREHLTEVQKYAPHTSPDWYRDGIEGNRLIAMGAFHAGDMVGVVIYGFEPGDHGREMVIFAARGLVRLGGHGIDWIAAVWPTLQGIAEGMGCESVRFHTMRQGLIAKMRQHGFGLAEYVLRKDLAYGR